MNSFTPQSKQWYVLRVGLFIVCAVFLSSQSVFSQMCNLNCPPADTVYNLSFDANTCNKIIDYNDFNYDTTDCGTNYVLQVIHENSQDTLVNGQSDTVSYFYVRDTLSFRFYMEGQTQADTCEGRIVICDTVPPTVSVQDTFVYDIPNNDCQANISLPTDTISDNCGDATLTINAPGEDTLTSGSGYELTNVSPGTYPLYYEVTDSCSPPVRDTMILVVNRDNETPDITCDNGILFPASSIPVPINAEVFIETATDDCASQVYYKVRKMDDPSDPSCMISGNPDNMFDDQIMICCENIPTDTAIVRVYDVNPGPGPIPADTLSGRYSTCMVEFIVQDKDTPTITAPTDVSISCGTPFDTTDLSSYGDIAFTESERDTFTVNGQEVIDGIVDDSCPDNIQVSEAVEVDTNLCGLGEIRRIFTASDAAGNAAKDTQHISISQDDLFDEDNIDWPSDTTVFDCNPYPGPDITGYADIDTLECTMIGWHYTDKLYSLNQGCFKILRQWTVIDWCQNDPNEQDDDWKFMHEQVIKINDTTAPQFPFLDTVSVEHTDPNCGPITVNLTPVTATDCSLYSSLDYTIQIDYGNNGTIDTSYAGNNASGDYPNGSSRIIYTAEDGCGNIGEADQIIEIIDNKPPSGTTVSQISVNLSLMNGTPMLMVPADVFNPSIGSMANLQDNCTSSDNLQFSYGPDINNNELIVDCDNVGDTTLTIFVWDEAGNSASVNSTLTVTDTDSLCPQTSSGATVSGKVMVSGLQQPMPGVNVNLKDNSNEWNETTNTEGRFAFPNMNVGSHYTVHPAYDENHLNGVSTYDLVLIQRHILGIKTFSEVHQYVAADINDDRKISATDMVDLRRAILGMIDAFPNNHSWRIIPGDFQMNMSPGKPLPDFPEEKTVQLDKQGNDVPFEAVKVGDINGSLDMDGLTSTSDRTKETVHLEFENRTVQRGEVIELPFYLAEGGSLLGIQGALDVDPDYAEVVYAQSDALPDFSPNNIGTDEQTGETRFSWHQPVAVKIGSGEPIMRWTLRIKQDGALKDILNIHKKSITNELYDKNHQQRPMLLKLREQHTMKDDQILKFDKVYPNPFKDVTHVEFNAEREGTVTFSVIDAFGKKLFTKEYAFNRGSNQLQVNLKNLSVSGLLYYQLECDKQVITGKLIKARR